MMKTDSDKPNYTTAVASHLYICIYMHIFSWTIDVDDDDDDAAAVAVDFHVCVNYEWTATFCQIHNKPLVYQ